MKTATLSSSQVGLALLCPASLEMRIQARELGLEPAPNDAMQRGSSLHEAISSKTPSKLTGRDREAVEWALLETGRLATAHPPAEQQIEKRFWFVPADAGFAIAEENTDKAVFTCQPDCCWRSDGLFLVIDYKTGRSDDPYFRMAALAQLAAEASFFSAALGTDAVAYCLWIDQRQISPPIEIPKQLGNVLAHRLLAATARRDLFMPGYWCDLCAGRQLCGARLNLITQPDQLTTTDPVSAYIQLWKAKQSVESVLAAYKERLRSLEDSELKACGLLRVRRSRLELENLTDSFLMELRDIFGQEWTELVQVSAASLREGFERLGLEPALILPQLCERHGVQLRVHETESIQVDKKLPVPYV